MLSDNLFQLRSWPQAILHLDGDAFFASCEQAIHPELKGKPIITGQERNIVASMSYEAKALGIKRAVPLWEAKKICPHLIVLPSDYETYSLISKRMFSIMRRFTPVVEEASIDEGFADLQGLRRVYRMGYDGIALAIRDAIEKELDIPISVGVSLTKTLAKLAAKFKKPRGFTAVRGNEIHKFLQKIPVKDVCGIGPNTTSLLQKHRVMTAYDFAAKPEAWVKALLGKIGVELRLELRGEKVYSLETKEKTSYDSISKTKTFVPPSKELTYVRAQLFRNVESAFIKMRRYQLKAKRFLIYLKRQDFKGRGIQADLNRGTIAPQEAFPLLEEMLAQIYVPGECYRATGVVLSNLEEDREIQFELFEDPLRMIKLHRLAKEIDEINAIYGKHTVFAATGLHLRRNPEANLQMEGRHALPARKQQLLPGETPRQRLKIPLWQVRV